jgi:hypothetical protein
VALIGFWQGSIALDQDKALHGAVGYGMSATFRNLGLDANQSHLLVFGVALAKELNDQRCGREFDSGDVLATVIGGYCWDITEQVKIWFIIK